jgi:acetyl-CoA carboxylase carboxyltransferase component
VPAREQNLTAHERIEYVLDEGSFTEFGTFVEHRCTDFGMADRTDPGDAVVTRHGPIGGRTVAVQAHDLTFLGGVVSDKICQLIDWGLDSGVP